MIHGKNDFHTYAVQSEIGIKTTRYRGSKLWNNLPDDLKNTTSLLSFKHRLKSYLLHTLEQLLSEYIHFFIVYDCISDYAAMFCACTCHFCMFFVFVFFALFSDTHTHMHTHTRTHTTV